MPKNEYSIYRDAGPIEYRGFLECINGQLFEETWETIQPLRNLIDANGACVYLIGSDGKRERHPQSRSELFFVQPKGGTLTADQIYHLMPNYQTNFDVGYDGFPSIHTLGDSYLSFSYGNHHLIYPDTTLNSRFVYGSESLYKEARQAVLAEMKTRVILSAIKSQRNEYEHAVRSGNSRGRISFRDGKALYDESKGQETFGLKPLLRLTQRTLDIHTVTCMRAESVSANQLPSNTMERMEYFEIPEIYLLAYIWTLQQYHHSQELYKETRELVTVMYDKDKFRDVQGLCLNLSVAVKTRQRNFF